MPLYEYECPSCGRFEVIRKFSDKPLKKCPTCGKAIQKLASAPAIQFKGSGWYVNDYAKSGAKGTKDEAKADAGGKDSAKADASSSADAGASKSPPSKDSPAPSGSGASKSSKKKSA